MEKLLDIGRYIIPHPLFKLLAPAYHWLLAWSAAIWYLFPSRKLKVIGVTGTKGKSTTVYLIAKLLEGAGEKVASVGSLGYKINDREWPNPSQNSMPGRFKLQKFLREAVKSGAKYAVIEVTSEGIKQFRHLGINFDTAVFTNLEPEHIEHHGSFENYYAEKQKLFKQTKDIHIINKDDKYTELFSNFPAKEKIFYSAADIKDLKHNFTGKFNEYNIAAAVSVLKVYGVPIEKIKLALEKIQPPQGRLEEIKTGRGFRVFVDYAHTPNSLRNVYQTLHGQLSNVRGQMSHMICVLGAAGGGRDKWKRPELGKIAAEYCDEIILTDEDSYDESPAQILSEIKSGLVNVKSKMLKVYEIVDRKEAIKKAISLAKENDIVIITGKGSESSIHIAGGKKIPWDDRRIVKEIMGNN